MARWQGTHASAHLSGSCLSQQQEDDSGGEDDAEVQQECLHKFSTRDYIMEPSIFNTLKRCVSAVHTRGLRRVLWCKECALGVEGLKSPLAPWKTLTLAHAFLLPACSPRLLCGHSL